jgi:flagellar protein FlgJ
LGIIENNKGIPRDYQIKASMNKNQTNERELKEVCQQFESILLSYMLKSMRNTVPDGGLFDRGVTFDLVQSMHDEAMAEEISKSGGIGLANQLYEQLSKYI